MDLFLPKNNCFLLLLLLSLPSRPVEGQVLVPQTVAQPLPQAGGLPQVGQPQVGQPQVGQPQVGQPQVGNPQVGQPQVGQPQGQEVQALQGGVLASTGVEEEEDHNALGSHLPSGVTETPATLTTSTSSSTSLTSASSDTGSTACVSGNLSLCLEFIGQQMNRTERLLALANASTKVSKTSNETFEVGMTPSPTSSVQMSTMMPSMVAVNTESNSLMSNPLLATSPPPRTQDLVLRFRRSKDDEEEDDGIEIIDDFHNLATKKSNQGDRDSIVMFNEQVKKEEKVSSDRSELDNEQILSQLLAKLKSADSNEVFNDRVIMAKDDKDDKVFSNDSSTEVTKVVEMTTETSNDTDIFSIIHGFVVNATEEEGNSGDEGMSGDDHDNQDVDEEDVGNSGEDEEMSGLFDDNNEKNGHSGDDDDDNDNDNDDDDDDDDRSDDKSDPETSTTTTFLQELMHNRELGHSNTTVEVLMDLDNTTTTPDINNNNNNNNNNESSTEKMTTTNASSFPSNERVEMDEVAAPLQQFYHHVMSVELVRRRRAAVADDSSLILGQNALTMTPRLNPLPSSSSVLGQTNDDTKTINNVSSAQGGLATNPQLSPLSLTTTNVSNFNVLPTTNVSTENSENSTMATPMLSPLSVNMSDADQEELELQSAPKGLVLKVLEKGDSKLDVGQLVDGNLNPINNETINNRMMSNNFSGVQNNNPGVDDSPRMANNSSNVTKPAPEAALDSLRHLEHDESLLQALIRRQEEQQEQLQHLAELSALGHNQESGKKLSAQGVVQQPSLLSSSSLDARPRLLTSDEDSFDGLVSSDRVVEAGAESREDDSKPFEPLDEGSNFIRKLTKRDSFESNSIFTSI